MSGSVYVSLCYILPLRVPPPDHAGVPLCLVQAGKRTGVLPLRHKLHHSERTGEHSHTLGAQCYLDRIEQC